MTKKLNSQKSNEKPANCHDRSMLISHRHRFLFIHVYKNAGSSIKKALRPYTISKWQAAANHVIKRVGLKQFSHSPYPDHASASYLFSKTGMETFRSHFSFAIVRNPWDWEVSLYKYVLKNRAHFNHALVSQMSGFDEYLGWRAQGKVRTQQEFIDHRGHQLVEFVGRFETLEVDWKIICERIGVNATLPVRNATGSRPYQEFYNPRLIEIVRQMFRVDVERFQYSFDDAADWAKSA